MIRSKERFVFDNVSRIHDSSLSIMEGNWLKDECSFFSRNGTLLALTYVVSQFWRTHTHGGGTGQNATLKHFENE